MTIDNTSLLTALRQNLHPPDAGGVVVDFRRLYEEIAPRLTNYLVGSGSPYATACDIVQTSFLRVWERRDELTDDPAQISGLLFTVARNYRTDLLRRGRREVLKEEIVDADYADAGRSGAAGPDEALARADESRWLRGRLDAALAELPPTLREAFTLFQLGGLSIREIARQTATTETNVKVRIHRAKMKLREILKDIRVTSAGVRS